MSNLVEKLIEDGWLKTPRIIEAFYKIKREDFLLEKSKALAELNEALPIGFGQTISQPLTVAFMLEKLEPEPGDRVLDIGSGSGWTTALLAQIVGEKGRVIGMEIIPELMEFGRENVAKYNFIEKGIVKFICSDGSKGYKQEAPYDKILVSAALPKEIPFAWKKQLEIEGRIVAPINSSIWLFVKKTSFFNKETMTMEDKFEKFEYPGFSFVPYL